MAKFFRFQVTAQLDVHLVADDEDDARVQMADMMRYAEIAPYQIIDWDIEDIEEGLEEDE